MRINGVYYFGVNSRLYDTLQDNEADDGMALYIVYCTDRRMAVLRFVYELAVCNNGNERTVCNAACCFCACRRPAAALFESDSGTVVLAFKVR